MSENAQIISRREFLVMLLAGLLWGGLPACRRAPASPLVVAAHKWPGYEFMFLAERDGLLSKNEIVLQETPSATDSLRALADGSAQAAALTLDEVLRARGKGIPLTVVLVFDVSTGADVVLARPGIGSLKEIKGKRIGVEDGALGALMLSEALKEAGLHRSDVTVIPLTVDQHEAAWKRGDVDVLVSYPPVSIRILEMGAVKLFDSRQIPDTIVDVLAVRQDVLKDKEDFIRHLISAHLRELDHLQMNPQDAIYRMAGHLGIPENEVLTSYKGMLLPDLEQNHRLLGGGSPALLGSAKKLAEVMLKEKMLARPDSLNGFLSAAFLPREET